MPTRLASGSYRSIPDNIIIKRLPMGFALRERLEPIRKIVSLVFLDSPKTALATIST
jgi:hypothetical protein